MIFDNIFKSNSLEQRPYLSIFFGICFTFIAFFAGWIFFRSSLSLVMVFIITLLMIPVLTRLISMEENKSAKGNRFWRTHKDIIEIYIFLFLGVFIGYLIIGSFVSAQNSDMIFEFQTNYIDQGQGLTKEIVNNFSEELPPISLGQVGAILTRNLTVGILAFLLSFLYGVSAIFLIVLNGSVFATFILYLINFIGKTSYSIVKIVGFFSLHMIPEISGFLVASIAGGIVSKAWMSENKKSKEFSLVMRDASKLFIISILLIVVAAFIEVYITTNLFYNFL